MRGDRVVVTNALSVSYFLQTRIGGSGPCERRSCFRSFIARRSTVSKEMKLPSDQTLRSELIADRGFNPKAVDGFLKDFRASLAYAGISTENPLDSSAEELEEPDTHDEGEQLKPEEEIQEKPGNANSSENAQIQGIQRCVRPDHE